MENRVITIADTKTQRRYELTTAATTLGELQDEMTAQGIDFTGMTFTEGFSKTQLLSRESLLPTNVMFKGQPTNNLVMLLTNTNKNIASGCCEVPDRSRKSAYKVIKYMGKEAAAEIEAQYGRNYTQVPTISLWEYIDSVSEELDEPEEEENNIQEEDKKPEPAEFSTIRTASNPDFVELIYLGIKYVNKKYGLTVNDIAVLAELLTELYQRRQEEQEIKVSDEDINDMIANM